MANNPLVPNLPVTRGANTFTGAQVAYSFAVTSSVVPANGMYLSASNTLAFSTNSVSRATLNSSGDLLTTGNNGAYSDERLKTNWRDLPNKFVEKLSFVKAGIYDRTDQESTQVGVSAQSLRDIMPNAVMKNEDGILSVAYGNAALAACVMLAREVEWLKSELTRIEGAQ